MKSSQPGAAVGHAYACCASIAKLQPEFESLVDKAIRAVVACDPKPDRIFGNFAELVSVTRSVAFHEGILLERGIAATARCNPDLVILPPDRPMPIVPAAIELLRKNEWHEIQGIRLPSEVYAAKTYTPDLFIANRKRHAGLIIDVKRSLASYAESKLETLRFRMMAVAAIASSWLGERQGPVLVEVGTAIIDGADVASDHDKGVFALSEIGDLLEVEGAGEAMTLLRKMFARRVQQELGSQCREVLGVANPSLQRTLNPNIDLEESDTEEFDDEIFGVDEHPKAIRQKPERGRLVMMPTPASNVRVGFARSRASP